MSETKRSRHRLVRPDLAVEIVLELVKQKAEEIREARAEALKRPRRRRQPLYLLGLVGLFCGLTAWNVVRAGHVPTVFSPAEIEASVRYRIYLATRAVEAYRDSAGAFPAALAAAGIDDEGLLYLPARSTYSIVAENGAGRISYRRGDNLAPFVAAYGALARGGGG
jgi:hypothetical protein